MNILVVEDNPQDYLLFEHFVGPGAKTMNASTGAEALDRIFRRGKFAEAPAPDLVVLDLNVPLLTGHEVLNVLKSNSVTMALPVVVWSGSDRPSDIERAFALGACAYVLKTSSLEETERRLMALSEFWVRSVLYPSLRSGRSRAGH